MKTKIVKLEFNLIVDVDDDATQGDIIEQAREQLRECADDDIEANNLISITEEAEEVEEK